ncbi:MAG: VacJ family lipoprotein [Mariprofundaceae bacterium]|nr:VacJ family lipoprotein [Mariprofundaceae bacterium]
MLLLHGMIATMKKIFIIVFMLLLQTGCATVENDFDPLESSNRAVDSFNTGLDEVALRPVSKAYTAVIPPAFRTATTNFFENLLIPNTIVNDLLQGKLDASIKDTYRFVINSTLGIFGLIDVAHYTGVPKHKEDFGQTLAVWGVDQGAYLVYPLLGPNSVRNTPGTIMEYVLDGATYLSLVLSPEAVIGVTILKYVDIRANLEDAVNMRDAMALDAYVFTREAWRQSREYSIYDGHPPASVSQDDDDEFSDDFDDDFDDDFEDDFASE